MDFTPGGAPVGLTEREFRRSNAQLEHRAGWTRAKFLLERAFEMCSSPLADVEVGRVKKVREGLFRKVYAAAGGDPITRSEVHFYELCLAARWYRDALHGRGSEPPEQALTKLRGILRRARESTP